MTPIFRLFGGVALACALSMLGAASGVLKPLPLSAACQKAGYSALQDTRGTLRVLRYLRTVPDNSQRLTQYYDAAGRLQSVKASASGFAGLLYDLSARFDAQGKVLGETGYRSKLYRGSLKTLLRDAGAVRAGRCDP
ncbi:hypothetical protein [Deinococcus sp.]|uniref:hypothetical protein n=1 Tax=Deinococcus sp. TaxID=47478 RepID=UPI003CC6418F